MTVDINATFEGLKACRAAFTEYLGTEWKPTDNQHWIVFTRESVVLHVKTRKVWKHSDDSQVKAESIRLDFQGSGRNFRMFKVKALTHDKIESARAMLEASAARSREADKTRAEEWQQQLKRNDQALALAIELGIEKPDATYSYRVNATATDGRFKLDLGSMTEEQLRAVVVAYREHAPTGE